METKASNIKKVSKSRLVAALLNELDAAFATVLAEDPATSVVFKVTINCEIKVPFDQTEILLETGSHSASVLNCVCCFGGQRISFQIARISANRWRLPNTIDLIDLRHNSRLAFSSRAYSAELITPRGSVYGYAVDLNRDYLAIDMESIETVTDGSEVQVVIRMVNTTFDVFYRRCVVSKVLTKDANLHRVIVRLESVSGNKAQSRRHERRLVNSSSIHVSGGELLDGSMDASLPIQNISLGGMTVFVDDNKRTQQLIAGMIVRSKDPELSFLVVWGKSHSLGLRPLLSENGDLAKWCHYVDRVAPPEDHGTKVTRKELANLLTHSGLLKGKRRDHFGRDMASHLISNHVSDSPLLSQRRVISDEKGDPVLYANLRRYTEQAWLFTDGVSFSAKEGSFVEMLKASIVSTRAIMDLSSQLPRYLTFIWHETVKSSGEFASALAEQAKTLVLDAAQVSIKRLENLSNGRSSQDQTIRPFSHLSADIRRSIGKQFSPELFEAVVGFDGSHPVLNSELTKFGPYHSARTVAIETNESHSFVAHRIFTHNVWSTTGVTNSVFVLCPSIATTSSICAALSLLAKADLSYGTDDFLIVFDGALGLAKRHFSSLPEPKHFSFLVQDLVCNQSLLFLDSIADDRLRNDSEDKSPKP